MGLWQSTQTHIANSPDYAWVQKKSQEQPVVLFSKTTCGYCRIAKKTLDEEQIIYLTHEINQMENCSQIQDVLQHMTGARTVPRVFINGKSIGGCSELTELTKRGALKEMLQSSAVKGRPTGDSNTFSSS